MRELYRRRARSPRVELPWGAESSGLQQEVGGDRAGFREFNRVEVRDELRNIGLTS